ncbi:ATP-dependent RecD-like DNA helicase [Bartonella sp. DGB1]|uniref:ATP-dependent DNA helicase n=1 Tax=Bartonella sp. DGB1 TaxID=3239807 RepID=UPI0035234D63
MNFSNEQSLALLSISNWIKEKNKPIFRVFGYAGTGKTTLAKYIAQEVDGLVLFVSYTAKSAHMLSCKGTDNASTIHSLIYRLEKKDESIHPTTGKKDNKLHFVINEHSKIKRAKLVIIDECSMINRKIAEDLLSFGVPILLLGDPAQLPPIEGDGFFINEPPDILLTEIHRQAKESSIILLSEYIRKGGRLTYGNYGDVEVIKYNDFDKQQLLLADQILVGSHASRNKSNQLMRQFNNMNSPYPAVNDKLICCSNSFEKDFFNGSLWQVTELLETKDDNAISMKIDAQDEDRTDVKISLSKSFFNPNFIKKSNLSKKKYDDFDYGYALTVHKAQGSQWNNICLFDESYFFKENSHKWLYTAITRAVKKLTIIK